jgi:hypothetical protein
MIARLWHGVTLAPDSDAYWAFLHERFTDPRGHRLEVTTYDAESVRRARER